MSNQKVILVSFYTKGPPFDSGVNLSKVANEFKSRYYNLFDRVILLTPSSLVKYDSRWKDILYNDDYVNAHLGSAQRADSINLDWINLNSLLFKPAILHSLLALDSGIDEGSIIIFHDINLGKYPVYTNSIQNLPAFFENVSSRCSIFLIADVIIALSSDCKQELLRSYLNVSGRNLCHRWGGFVAFRKNNHSRRFCADWYCITAIDSNRSQLTSCPNYPGFVWHSQEQSTLSVVYYLWRYNFTRHLHVKSFFTPICRDVAAKWRLSFWVKYFRDSFKLHVKSFFLGSVFDRVKISFLGPAALDRLFVDCEPPPPLKMSEH